MLGILRFDVSLLLLSNANERLGHLTHMHHTGSVLQLVGKYQYYPNQVINPCVYVYCMCNDQFITLNDTQFETAIK